MIDESLLMPDWYYPAVRGAPVTTRIRQDYIDAWHQVLNHLPALDPTLVLRDFHIDNLIQVNRGDVAGQCGLLDFQDAVIGPPAYDLMSLLEDARRDISPESVESMLRHYLSSMPDIDSDFFMSSYHVLGLQRHCKVAGIFTRLATRDAKPAYRQHLPRVLKFISLRLNHPLVMPIREWFEQHLPEVPNRESIT
jgi:aminoglycoside/choline kinase family phosphotransferase